MRILLFILLLAPIFAAGQQLYGTGVGYVNGTPTFTPNIAQKGSELCVSLNKKMLYLWNRDSAEWKPLGGITVSFGAPVSAPAYGGTRTAINMQTGLIYWWDGSTWKEIIAYSVELASAYAATVAELYANQVRAELMDSMIVAKAYADSLHLADNDRDSTNELQNLVLIGSILSITDGNAVDFDSIFNTLRPDSLARAATLSGFLTPNTLPYIDANGRLNSQGFIEFPVQSSAPGVPSAGFRMYADAAGQMVRKTTNDPFSRTTDGILTANRTYTDPDGSGTYVLREISQTFTGVNTFAPTGSGGAGFIYTSTTRPSHTLGNATTAQITAMTGLTTGDEAFNITTGRGTFWSGSAWLENIAVAQGGLPNTYIARGDASGNITGSAANTFNGSVTDVTTSTAGLTGYTVTNSNSGVSAYAGMVASNNSGNAFTVAVTAQNYSGLGGGHTGIVNATGQGGLVLAANNGSGNVRIYAGGTTERMRVHTGGQVTIGTSPSSAIATLGVITAEGATLSPTGGIHVTNTNASGVASMVFNNAARNMDFAATGSSFTSGPTGLIQANEGWLVQRLAGGLGFAVENTSADILFATTGAGSAGILDYNAMRMSIGSNGNVSIGVLYGATLQASAVLQLHSTTKGFRLPVMTDAQIAAISSPTDMLMAASTTDQYINVKKTAGWAKLAYTTDIPTAKRDTNIYINDANYDFSAALTTAQIAARYNQVIFWMTTTAAAAADSELTLHTPDANLLQVQYLIHSVDEPAGFDNKIVFGTNNAVDSTNGLVANYYPGAGDGITIRVGLRSGVYKYRYNN